MKRLLLSVVGGFAIPFLYAIITGPLSLYTHSERLNYLLWIPIGWPKIVYYYLFPPFPGRALRLEDDTLLIIIIVCDVALYALLTYGALWLLSLLRRPKPRFDPPPPPAGMNS